METRYLLERYRGNRRKDVRLKMQLPARMRLTMDASASTPRDVEGVSSDVSLHGARLLVHADRPIPNGASVELQLGKSFFGWKFRFTGMIRWIQREAGLGHGILGVFFKDMTPRDEKAWIRFLEKEAHRLKLPSGLTAG